MHFALNANFGTSLELATLVELTVSVDVFTIKLSSGSLDLHWIFFEFVALGHKLSEQQICTKIVLKAN